MYKPMLETLEDRLTPSAYYFRGPGQDWAALANWRVNEAVPALLPTTTDDVLIDHNSPLTVSITNGVGNCSSINVNNWTGSFYLNNSTLNIGIGTAIGNDSFWYTGTISANANASVVNVNNRRFYYCTADLNNSVVNNPRLTVNIYNGTRCYFTQRLMNMGAVVNVGYDNTAIANNGVLIVNALMGPMTLVGDSSITLSGLGTAYVYNRINNLVMTDSGLLELGNGAFLGMRSTEVLNLRGRLLVEDSSMVTIDGTLSASFGTITMGTAAENYSTLSIGGNLRLRDSIVVYNVGADSLNSCDSITATNIDLDLSDTSNCCTDGVTMAGTHSYHVITGHNTFFGQFGNYIWSGSNAHPIYGTDWQGAYYNDMFVLSGFSS